MCILGTFWYNPDSENNSELNSELNIVSFPSDQSLSAPGTQTCYLPKNLIYGFVFMAKKTLNSLPTKNFGALHPLSFVVKETT